MRQLRMCDTTLSTVIRLPVGCAESILRFNISIPAGLWKVIVDRQAAAVADGVRSYNSVTLLPVRDIRDISVTSGAIGLLSRHLPPGLCVHNATFVQPVSEEEFRSYGLSISYITVSFGAGNFNIGVVLRGLTGSGTGRVIFSVNRFPHLLTERPSGALVSYVINI